VIHSANPNDSKVASIAVDQLMNVSVAVPHFLRSKKWHENSHLGID
jgi:hypothetical protein